MGKEKEAPKRRYTLVARYASLVYRALSAYREKRLDFCLTTCHIAPMKTIKSKTVVYETLEHAYPNGVRYVELRENGSFVSASFVRPEKDKIYKDHSYIHRPVGANLLQKHLWHDIGDKHANVFEWKQKQLEKPEEFSDWGNVIHFGGGIDGMSWRILDKSPISTPIYCDYIGGYDNAKYDLAALEEYLETVTGVSDVARVHIPSYHQSEDHETGLLKTEAVKFTCLLPQKVYDSLFLAAVKSKEIGSWSCRLVDAVKCSYTKEDPLNIKKRFALKPKIVKTVSYYRVEPM